MAHRLVPARVQKDPAYPLRIQVTARFSDWKRPKIGSFVYDVQSDSYLFYYGPQLAHPSYRQARA